MNVIDCDITKQYTTIENLNLNYLKELIDCRNKYIELYFLYKNNNLAKLYFFDSICKINHSIANLLNLPNVKTLQEVKEELFNIEINYNKYLEAYFINNLKQSYEHLKEYYLNERRID